MQDYDYAIRLMEDMEEKNVYDSKEEKNMNNVKNILKNAVSVYADLYGAGKKTRYEQLVDGRWFEWATHTSIEASAFERSLAKLTFGKELEIVYVK